MKNIVVGIIIGAALVYSGQAMADSISNVGKTIDAEYNVVVDGQRLDVKAISVEGVSTTPNRALGNAIGYDVTFKDGTVYFNRMTADEPLVQEETGDVVETEFEILNKKALEFAGEFRKYSKAKGILSDEWYSASDERKIELESEMKELDKSFDLITEEFKPFIERKAELEAQQ